MVESTGGTRAYRHAPESPPADQNSPANSAEKMPLDRQRARDWALAAYRRRDWDEAVRRWAEVRSHYEDEQLAYWGAAKVLREIGHLEEAEAILEDARQRFPESGEWTVEYALLARARRDWPEAIRRLELVRQRQPGHPAGYGFAAEALTEESRFSEAEQLMQVAIECFPENPFIFRAWATLATKRDDPTTALKRWTEAQRRFPQEKEFPARLAEAQMRVIEADPTGWVAAQEAAPAITAEQRPLYDTMMRFESLGNGCEFGDVQRHFGAEPLNLLRWASILPEGLVSALTSGLEGIGAPEQTELSIRSRSGGGEYWLRDRRYGFEMHTFVGEHQVPYGEMFEKSCRRLRYLSRKLLDDLAAAEKILVYKLSHRNLTDSEIYTLHAALRRYGPATLLCVRKSDAAHLAGHVEFTAPGLMLGYLEKFAEEQENGRLDVPIEQWTALCRTALQLYTSAPPADDNRLTHETPSAAAAKPYSERSALRASGNRSSRATRSKNRR